MKNDKADIERNLGVGRFFRIKDHRNLSLRDGGKLVGRVRFVGVDDSSRLIFADKRDHHLMITGTVTLIRAD